MSVVLWPNGSVNIPHVTSEYGPRTAPLTGASTFHRGIDVAGFPVNKSPVGGVVTFAGYGGSGGLMVVIRAGNGDTFMLAHNARLMVSQGQRVLAGQDVGVQGMTGVASGVHCHFEIRPGGGATVNPRDYMAAHITLAGTTTPITGSSDDMTDRIIRTPGGSIGLAAGDGDFLPLHSMNEVEVLRATTLTDPTWIQLPDNNIWNVRVALAARKQLAKSSDPTALATTIAGLLVPAVVAALAGRDTITRDDVQEAAEAAMRTVFSDAAGK